MRAPTEPADPFYAALRLVARFWIWFLFHQVSVRDADRVPLVGPVLLCVNHPNNLIDSLLVGAVLPRKVHYLATATLFRHRVLAAFLARAGAIPVHRPEDGAGAGTRNAEMFAACQRVLAAGRVLAIYPEGTTHAEPRVQRIRTGAARIALEHEAGGPEAGAAPRAPARPGLALVPVGLVFHARKSFRRPVWVAFGQPIPLDGLAAAYRRDPAAAVTALTATIQAAMEAQVVHLARRELDEVLRAVEDLYRDDLVAQLRADRGLAPERVDALRLSRTIAAAVEHFELVEPERVQRLVRRVRHYRALLARWRVRDQAVRARLPGSPSPPAPWRGWRAAAGLPLALYGAAVNALPYLGSRWLARRVAHRETDYATIRLLASLVAFPLGWGLPAWVIWRSAGAGWAAVFLVSLPLSGLVAARSLGRLGRLLADARLAGLAVTHRHAASRLLAERRAIVAELERAKGDFLAATRAASRMSP